MTRAPIPRHEPEVVKASAKAYWGDDEKVPTTSIRGLRVHGANLSSRYDKAGEYETMSAMMNGLSLELRPLVDSIFCDSKAQACYSVELKPCSVEEVEEIGRQLEHVCLECDGGHNGIFIDQYIGRGLILDPRWSGDEFGP